MLIIALLRLAPILSPRPVRPRRTSAAHTPRRRIEAGDQIADRWAGTQRRPVGFAGYAHETAHRLSDEIERGTVAVRPAFAKPRDVATDETGLEDLEPRVVEPQAGENSGSKILDYHITAGDQLCQHLATFFALQVERHGAFVAVERREIPAEPVADHALPPYRVARARRFDLDHFGAH